MLSLVAIVRSRGGRCDWNPQQAVNPRQQLFKSALM
jgi:hypothetical protein